VDVSQPHRAISPGLEGDVLVLLAGTTRPLSGRTIARRLGLASHDGVRKALERLVAQGIVDRLDSGGAFLHSLNRDHVGADAVLQLAGMRTQLWTRVRAAFASWPVPAVHASAFGSAARGDGDVDSDIDLLVVRPARIADDDERWRSQISALAEGVRRWTGNDASIIELDERAVAQRPTDTNVIDEVRRDGIDLAGAPVRKLFRTERVAT
jgi:predicted nucleotidyltransferase